MAAHEHERGNPPWIYPKECFEQARHAFFLANLTHKEQAPRPAFHEIVAAEHAMVVAGSHHKHTRGVHAVLGNDLTRLLVMKSEHGVKVADGTDDAIALEPVRAHLAEIRRVTDTADGHAVHELTHE